MIRAYLRFINWAYVRDLKSKELIKRALQNPGVTRSSISLIFHIIKYSAKYKRITEVQRKALNRMLKDG